MLTRFAGRKWQGRTTRPPLPRPAPTVYICMISVSIVSMDWIRRNWPDLLIGLALLLVIGGIIATLLNGGNFLPLGRNNANQPATVTTGANTADSNATNAVDPTTPTAATGVAGSNTADNTTNSGTAEGGVAPVDLNNPDGVSTDTVTMPNDQGGDGTIVAVSPTLEEEGAAPATTATPDATATPQTPTESVAASSAPTAPYRISVGAFGSAENAERKAQSFRDAGYPVFVGNQGDLALVLVGPYDSQAEAEQVKTQLQTSGLEANPIIYEFSPSDSTIAGDTSATTTATTPAESTTDTTADATATSETPATSAPPTSGSGSYLQVGAYGSLESAAPQRSKLEGLGFTVSSVEEGSFVKLLVGPYDDAALSSAQSQLTAQGIDSFVR
jgi:cell division septation protein DedD